MAWTLTEGEDLEGQGFSDLSHEIAHLYFLDLMGNPQGLHPPHAWLHEAVACWHDASSRTEIDVVEMNRQIAAWASGNAQQLLEAGVRNMTWYAQSLSVLEFILEHGGAAFVRQMAGQLREGARMEDLLATRPRYPGGLPSFEEQLDPLGRDSRRAGDPAEPALTDDR